LIDVSSFWDARFVVRIILNENDPNHPFPPKNNVVKIQTSKE
jgi:hypothetical protein